MSTDKPHPHDPKSVRDLMWREAGKVYFVLDSEALEWAFKKITKLLEQNYKLKRKEAGRDA